MGEFIIISKPNSYSIWVFFFLPESDNLYLPGPCFNVQMWPVLALPPHFEVLMVHSAGHGGVYHYFKTQLLLNLGVFFLLKVIVYSYQVHVSMWKCDQYWSCNFISKF